MRLFYYVHTGHRIGLDRFRRAAAIINGLGDVSIYVLKSQTMGDLFINKKSEKIGKSQLSTVMVSDDVPAFKVTILFIGAETNLDAAITYARANKVMTVTSIPELVSRGVTL